MNRIEKTFNEKQSDILSVYYPAGFPQLDQTLSILAELQKQGADMVEIGIPFSDPMADGVVIQEAANVALENGISLKLLFAQLEKMRETIEIPVVLMGYLNPIMQFGFEAFFKRCAEVGVDGVIIPDLPFAEYMKNCKASADKYNVNVIMLITPQTQPERVAEIDENTSGFIYMVSTAATTGAQNSFSPETIEYFKNAKTKNPRLIGFGISNPETYKAACENANGAIVGSHFVKLLKTEASIETAVSKLMQSLGR